MERLFGAWKRRFPCLQHDLATKLSTTANVIVPCAVLHNMAVDVNDIFEDDDDMVNVIYNNNSQPSTSSMSTTSTSDGLVLRANIISRYCTL